jgi:hypothetical protein
MQSLNMFGLDNGRAGDYSRGLVAAVRNKSR